YKFGSRGVRGMQKVNVAGTQNVLGTAFEVGIPRIVYTSTIAVLGDTRGKVVDEAYQMKGPWNTEYDHTKWAAHNQVAAPLIEQGAPIINVMPGAVYGPGDTSMVNDLLTLFYQGALPVFPGPETMLSFAHVEDIAEGHILAVEKGHIGEDYLLTGQIASLKEVVELCAQLLGRKPPLAYVPSRFLKPLIPVMDFLDRTFDLPDFLNADVVRILGSSYTARADKARDELGWRPRPLREGMEETISALVETTHPNLFSPEQQRTAAAIGLGLAAGIMLLWLLRRRRA
ncbi:MAG: NAD-dependent epimerase/dehydratase family protein, partial [Anaerolineaceae bacterium]|nr:NAD-dependent epimerase/dehydratase family protein [Anaerolineaceae bacterium]